MTPDKTRKFLQLLGAKVPQAQPRTGWIVCDCPLGPWRHTDGKSSPEVFGIRTEPGDARANCFACDWHGTQTELLATIRLMNKKAFAKKVDWPAAYGLIEEAEQQSELNLDAPGIEDILAGKAREPLHEYPEWWLDSFPPVETVPWALEYCQHGREGCEPLPIGVLQALDVRADTMQRRICFPVRDFKGVLRGLHGRAVDKGADPRYRMYTQAGFNNPLIWLGESWVDLNRPIVVVEGPFDLASVRRVYDNVVSPLFSNPSFPKLKRMADALEWWTFYDRGAGGNSGRAKVDKALSADHVIQHLHPPKGRKDPGEMALQELIEKLSPMGAVSCTF